MFVDLLPYLLSFTLTFLIGLLAWRNRNNRGIFLYFMMIVSEAEWILGYIFELVSQDQKWKLFWDNSCGIFCG